MKKYFKYSLCCILFLVYILFVSCEKEQTLDETTKILLVKEDKLKKLDNIFYLSFEDVDKAKKEFDEFVQKKLITPEYNYLTDIDILNRKKMTSLMIEINQNFKNTSFDLDKLTSVFDLYVHKFRNEIFNKGQYSKIPTGLKQGPLFDKFVSRLKELEMIYNQKIKKFVEKSSNEDTALLKNWYASIEIPQSVKDAWFYGLKIEGTLNYNFTFSSKSIKVNDFFLLPIFSELTYNYVYAGNFDDLKIYREPEYYIYNDKIFFLFSIANNVDPVTKEGDIKRTWFYEFDYHLKDGKLVLSNPKIGMYKQIQILISNLKDVNTYPEELKEITLTEK